MNIYYLKYKTSPIPGSSTERHHKEAVISGWIKALSIVNSKCIFVDDVKTFGWKPVELLEEFQVSEKDYEEGEELELKHFHEANMEGKSYYINARPDISE